MIRFSECLTLVGDRHPSLARRPMVAVVVVDRVDHQAEDQVEIAQRLRRVRERPESIRCMKRQ